MGKFVYFAYGSRIFNCSDASFDTYDSDSEKLHCTQIDSMIHNFLTIPKIMDYENTMYFISPSQHFHALGLFKDKHSKELNFPTLFYGQLQQRFEGFSCQ